MEWIDMVEGRMPLAVSCVDGKESSEFQKIWGIICHQLRKNKLLKISLCLELGLNYVLVSVDAVTVCVGA